MLPIRLKPSVRYDYSDLVTIIPNVLDIDEINRLREYAHSDISGLHRRGSKDKNLTASFYTCQIHPLSDVIYELLGPLWKPYKNITFIEPYEIKEYVEGDLFEYHNDNYFNLYESIDRKLNVIIQLSDESEYDGGELLVGDYVCSKEQGSAIIFPACITHAVNKITRGKRYSLIGHGWGPYHI